jgi:hypothetical protein
MVFSSGVQTEFLNIIYQNFGFKELNSVNVMSMSEVHRVAMFIIGDTSIWI